MTYYFLALYYRYLNGFGPLQIGGVENALENAKINYAGFKGCIRNIKDNEVMYDLLNPLKERNTELGCNLENNLCPDCNDHGYCEPLWTNSICVCDLGYNGPNCNSSKICCIRLEFVRHVREELSIYLSPRLAFRCSGKLCCVYLRRCESLVKQGAADLCCLQ